MINIAEYLKNPDRCPYCAATVIAVDTDFSDIHAYRNIVCPECGIEWTEEFTITGITESK